MESFFDLADLLPQPGDDPAAGHVDISRGSAELVSDRGHGLPEDAGAPEGLPGFLLKLSPNLLRSPRQQLLAVFPLPFCRDGPPEIGLGRQLDLSLCAARRR